MEEGYKWGGDDPRSFFALSQVINCGWESLTPEGWSEIKKSTPKLLYKAREGIQFPKGQFISNIFRVHLLYKTRCILFLLGQNSCQELGCHFLAQSISFNSLPGEWGTVVSQEAH